MKLAPMARGEKAARIVARVKMMRYVMRSMEVVFAQMVGKVIDVIFLVRRAFLESTAKKNVIARATQSAIRELDFATSLKVI